MADTPLYGTIRNDNSCNKITAAAVLDPGEIVSDLGKFAAVTGESQIAVGEEAGLRYDVRVDILKETLTNTWIVGADVFYDPDTKTAYTTTTALTPFDVKIGIAARASSDTDKYVSTMLNF